MEIHKHGKNEPIIFEDIHILHDVEIYYSSESRISFYSKIIIANPFNKII